MKLNKEGYRNFILLQHIWASLSRGSKVFCLGALLGIPLGLTNWAYGRFDPIVGFVRPVPSLALIPLMIIWFGIGETSKVILLSLAALWIMANPA